MNGKKDPPDGDPFFMGGILDKHRYLTGYNPVGVSTRTQYMTLKADDYFSSTGRQARIFLII